MPTRKQISAAQTAAHYRAMAAGAKRMKAMGGGPHGPKPPRKKPPKGCVVFLLASVGFAAGMQIGHILLG